MGGVHICTHPNTLAQVDLRLSSTCRWRDRHKQPCCLLGTESPLPSNHTWDGDSRASVQLHATAPVDSDAPAPRPSPVPLRGGGVEKEEVRDVRCPMHSKHTAMETEARRQMMHRVCLMLRCGARTLTSGGPPVQVIVGRRGPARLAPTEFHKESLPARAPLTLTGAGGDSGSRRLRLRAEAGSGARGGGCSIPAGPLGVCLELTVPPARRAHRSRAPCSCRAARRREPPPSPRTRARAKPARTAQVRSRPEPSRIGSLAVPGSARPPAALQTTRRAPRGARAREGAPV